VLRNIGLRRREQRRDANEIFPFFSKRASSEAKRARNERRTNEATTLQPHCPKKDKKKAALSTSPPQMATSTRTGGTAAGTLAKKVASDIRAAIAEGHAPAAASGGGGGSTRQQQRKQRGAAAAATNPSLSFDEPDHKLSAVRQVVKELTEGMHEDAARQALASRPTGDAVEATGLARALAEALGFARRHAEGALSGIEQHARSAAGSQGKKSAAAPSKRAAAAAAAAAATLRLAVSALIAAASACNDAARWGSKGPDASGAAADAVYAATGEEIWLAVTEE